MADRRTRIAGDGGRRGRSRSAGGAARASGASCSCRRSRTAAARSSCSKARRRGQEGRAEAARGRVRPLPFRRPLRPATTAARPPKAIGSRASGASCRAPATPRSSSAAGTAGCSTTACSAASTRRRSPRAFDEINEFEAQQRDYGTLHRQAVLRRQRRRSGAAAGASAATSPWRRAIAADDLDPRRRSRPIARRSRTCAPIPTRAGRRGG